MADSLFYIVRFTSFPDAALIESGTNGDGGQSQQDKTIASGIPPRAWLFQSSPVLYDLRGALRSLKEQVWSASRYAKKITPGDRVYLWEAGHRGGIAGIAEIIEPARLQPEPSEQLPFARDDEAFAGERLRTRLRIITVIAPVVARKTIVSCAELRALGVLRCSRGTNFPVTQDQSHALDELIQQAIKK